MGEEKNNVIIDIMEEQAAIDQQIRQLRSAGRSRLANLLKSDRQKLTLQYEQTLKRIDLLVNAVGRHLLNQYGGQRVTLYCQERQIALPVDVCLGNEIDDPRYLSTPFKIGVVEAGS